MEMLADAAAGNVGKTGKRYDSANVNGCNVLLSFYVRFYHCTAYTVYFHCLRVCLLRVTLKFISIKQSISVQTLYVPIPVAH